MSVALESRGNLGGEARRKLRQRNVKLAARRKRQTAPSQNGLYVHSSPPRAVQVNPSLIRQWLRSGDIDKLEQVILEGQGNKLFGEYSPEPRTRAFLRTVPQFLSKIDSLHSSVVNNNLGELTQGLEGDEKVMLGRKDIILAKDKTGLTVLHKAVGLGHQDIAAWLTSAYPTLLNVKDREGRNPLHYSACGPNPEDMWDVIAGAGADQSLVDNQGHSPPYYLDHPEQIKLPEGDDSPPTRNRFLNSRDGLNVTRANIRIWIHDRDLGRLQQVLWDGNGSKLRVETSNNPRVKRFLDAVPYIMGTIKDTHQAVINNDQAFLEKRTEDPVPANILATKDQNGLTPLHKAAGLGHKEMVEWMIERFPNGINLQDSQGRTPLHWAAKDSKTYNLLLDNGANTSIVDQKSHEPSYYKGKPSELDGRLLRVVPEAPRTTSAFPPAWDWRMLNHFSYDSYSNPVLNDQVHGNGEPWSQMPSRVDKALALRMAEKGKTSDTGGSESDTGVVTASEKSDKLVESEPIAEVEPEADVESKHELEPEAEDVVDKPEGEEEAVDNDDAAEEEETKTEAEQEEGETEQKEETEPEAQTDEVEAETESKDEEEDAGPMPEVETEINEKTEQEAKEGEAETDGEPEVEKEDEEANDDREPDAIQTSPEDERKQEGETETEREPEGEAEDEGESESKEASPEDDGNSEVEDGETEDEGEPNAKKKALLFLASVSGTENVGEQLNAYFDGPASAEEKEVVRAYLEEQARNEESNPEIEADVKESEASNAEEGNETKDESEHDKEDQADAVENEEDAETGKDEIDDETDANGNAEAVGDDENTGDADETIDNDDVQEGSPVSDSQTPGDEGSPSIEPQRIDEAEVLTLQQDFDPTTPSVDRMSYNHRPNTSTPSGADKQIELEDGVEDDEGVGDDDVIGEDRLADRSPSPTREDTDRTDDSGMHDPGSGGSENENDPEVNALIESSDMEGLASLVLNGQGWRLLNMRSGDTELQTFLSNVPQYMAKIRTVHVAAREGRLRDLQGSLDRRKFAVARDPEVSGMGATPLHVAALFGHTNIVRYLGARFPETLNARDNNGKTPLHYAATIKDNGHYYNLLTNLGANAAIKDLNGKPASYYQSHPQELTHEMLLHDFGLTQEDSSAATDLLRDQRHISHHGRNSEHSLYLQKELSSPLSRGLHEVVNVRPTDPVGYLGSYLTNYTRARSRVGFQEPATRTSTGFGAPIMTAIATGGVAAIATGGVAAAAAGVGAAASAGGAAVSTTGRVAASTAGRAAATATSFSSRSQPPPTSLHHRETVQTGTSALDANALAAAEATALINDPNSERADTPISPDTAFSSTNRDEHGQSMLHFAAARAHGRNALLELLHEASISVAYRDELYRTARDVAIQANLPENIRDIDRYVVSLAATGETQKLAELLIEGYDHIVDLDEEDGKSIIDLAMERGHHETVDFLNSVQPFEEKRERLHEGIRQGDFATVQHLLPTSNSNSNPNLLSIGKNLYGRCSLHIATLCQYDDIAEYIAKTFPETLRQGDNLERTALHYAMGLDQVETLSTMLINAGSKRVLKDLKGRQPSYYFMNKSDILRLQADEETLKAQ